MRLVDAVFMLIKELMKERGLTMYRLAILSGVPRLTIATMLLSKTVTLALNSIIHLAGKQSVIAQPIGFPEGKTVSCQPHQKIPNGSKPFGIFLT